MKPKEELPLAFVLDDDKGVRAVLKALLEGEGYDVFASDEWSVVGKKILSTRAPAVLVSDLNMTGIRGIDFCRTVVKHRPNVGVVLLSGEDPKSVAAAAADLKVRFAVKGDDPEDLLRSVTEAFIEARSRIVPSAS